MEPGGVEIQARQAEVKLAKGEPLSRAERIALLALMLTGQETRKERKYGEP